MANVATLIPGSTARVEEIKTAVQDLAVAHGRQTQDLVGGLYLPDHLRVRRRPGGRITPRQPLR